MGDASDLRDLRFLVFKTLRSLCRILGCAMIGTHQGKDEIGKMKDEGGEGGGVH